MKKQNQGFIRKFARISFMAGKIKPLLFSIFAMLSMAVLFQQCKHEPILKQNGGNPADTTNAIDTSICFERDILPLFVTNCAKSGCHDAITQKEGFKLYNYSGITVHLGDLMQNIKSGKMNSTSGGGTYGNLNTTQIALLDRWIKEGSKNNTTPCVSKCDTSKFTYTLAVKPLLDKYCNGCHTGASAGGGWVLNTYAGAKAVADNGKLVGSTNGIAGFSFMPKGSSKLASCQLTQINKWIKNGAPND